MLMKREQASYPTEYLFSGMAKCRCGCVPDWQPYIDGSFRYKCGCGREWIATTDRMNVVMECDGRQSKV